MKAGMDERLLRDVFSKDAFRGAVWFDEPMTKHTSLRIGGPAAVFAAPEDIPSLRHALITAKSRGLSVVALGGGTNILAGDRGIDGIVLSLERFRDIGHAEDPEALSVDAGCRLQGLLRFAAGEGLSGMEGLSGIPGTLGGAIAGNAGAFGYEIKDVVESVSIMTTEGNITVFGKQKLQFGYRGAVLPEGVILKAKLRLKEDYPETVFRRVEDFLKEKKKTQPLNERSAGCVFKNPPGASAGKLIDEARCKGMRVGDIEVSRVHANFFINKGRGRAEDFLRLMEAVIAKVKEASGVLLDPEIRILGGC